MDDAENLDRAASHIVHGAFWNMGENCSARLPPHRAPVREGGNSSTGSPPMPGSGTWAIRSTLRRASARWFPRLHFEKVRGYLDKAENVILGGKAADGFVEATVIEVSGNDALHARDEIFGPVLSVIAVSSFDEAIRIANDTEYGLCASIFTANSKRAIRGARAIRAGTVTVNSFGEGDITTPFGGYKQSGFGGRDNSIHAHDQYTQLKTIWIDLSDDADESVA